MALSLSSVTKNNLTKPPRIVIYGPAGIGKTSFAADAPDPVFLLLEDGLGRLKVPAFPLLKSYPDVLDALGLLYTEKHNYKTLVVDTLDWLEPLIWSYVCATWTDKDGNATRLKSIEDAGYGKGYVESLGYWNQFIDGLNALRDKGMMIILVCHQLMVKIEDPTHASYDAFGLKLHKKAAALIAEYADVVLRADIHTSIATEKKGFNQTRARAISNGSRIIHTVGQPAFLAKNRYSLTSPLPLSWWDFSEAMWPTPEVKNGK